MERTTLVKAAGFIWMIAAAGTASAVENITLRSGYIAGNPGTAGQTEDDISYGNVGGTGALSASAFIAADFDAASAGPLAEVVSTQFLPWIPTLPSDSQARWINWNADALSGEYGTPGSVIYRVPFTVTTGSITSASMDIFWACDDTLGDLLFGGANSAGAYVRDSFGNITVLSAVAGGNYGSETSALGVSLTGAISTGTNELFLYQRDQGVGVSGLIFSANIRVVPAPAATVLSGLALTMAGVRRRRR